MANDNTSCYTRVPHLSLYVQLSSDSWGHKAPDSGHNHIITMDLLDSQKASEFVEPLLLIDLYKGIISSGELMAKKL